MTWTTRQRFDLGRLRAIGGGGDPRVLMIHGVGLCADAWNAQLDALGGQHAVASVDMPGHGESEPFAGTPMMADFTDRIADCISGPTVVVGHSMGAVIALDMAARFPEKVKAVAALNGIFQRSDEATKAICARADSLDPERTNDPTPTLKRWFDDLTSPEAVACKTWLTSVNPRSYKTAYSLFANQTGPRADDLATIKAPALFMTGQKEPNSTPEMSLAMSQIVSGARAIIVDDAAHMMPMTHPEQVNQALAELIEEVRND